jgi:uncharacterized protein (DUF2235 family)
MGSKNALSILGKGWTKLIGLLFGYGISENIADGYQFLIRNYEEGDKIYIFGFSRGAYTARALSGILYLFGLLHQGKESLIPYMIRMAKGKHIDFEVAKDFKKTFSRNCKTDFLGLWDTVSSVGWIYNSVHFPYTLKNPELVVARHAVSIDERRGFYRQNLLKKISPDQDIVQRWFAGVHSDVGGGYLESVCELPKVTLTWMLNEAEQYNLKVNSEKKSKLLCDQPNECLPSYTGILHKSLHGFWWVTEFIPRFKHRYDETDAGYKRRFDFVRINMGRRRRINRETDILHESVAERIKTVKEYRPNNIKWMWE